MNWDTNFRNKANFFFFFFYKQLKDKLTAQLNGFFKKPLQLVLYQAGINCEALAGLKGQQI